MAMNIKNPEAQRLTAELADLTGESKTTAITESVRQRLQRVRRDRRAGLAERLLKIGEECAARLKGKSKAIDHSKLLYDEKGLPR